MEPPGGISPQRHVDEVRYVVRLTDHPSGGAAATVEGWVVLWSELDVSIDEAAQLATAPAWNPKTGVYEAYVAEQSYTQFEWGASGYGISFLMDVTSSLSADAVVAGVAYAVGRMRGSKRRATRWSPSIDDLGMVAVDSKHAIRDVFAESVDDLFVDEATRVGDSARVRVRGARGDYLVVITQLDTGDPICHVKRTG